MEGFGLLDAAVGWVAGLATAFGGLLVYRHTVKRDAFQDHCSSYKERIAMREKEVEQAVEGPDKDNKRRRLGELCDEYDQFLEAWQQKQELAKLAPRGAVSLDAPKLPPKQIARLVELLAGSTRLPAILLTADDYITRGTAYFGAGDYQQALEAYNRALELEPDDPATLNNRAVTLRRLGRHHDALKDYDRALELRPGHPNTLYNRGLALNEMGRHDDALRDYDYALELRPDDLDTLNNRGFALDDVGRYDDALKDYDRALELSPDDPLTLTNRANTLLKVKRYDDALKDCNRALELTPDFKMALYNRACAYSLTGHFEEALRDLELAVTGDEKHRKTARTDEDFEKLRNDPEYGPRFRKLVGE